MSTEQIHINRMVSINPDTLSVDMDGEKVAMDTSRNTFYGINKMGSIIWELIESRKMSIASILEILTDHFDQQDPEQIKAELLDYLEQCRDSGIVTIE